MRLQIRLVGNLLARKGLYNLNQEEISFLARYYLDRGYYSVMYLHLYLTCDVAQDCEELGEWVQEKKFIAQDETYRSAKTVHSKWTRHQAFEAEIASNKERMGRVQQVKLNNIVILYKTSLEIVVF